MPDAELSVIPGVWGHFSDSGSTPTATRRCGRPPTGCSPRSPAYERVDGALEVREMLVHDPIDVRDHAAADRVERAAVQLRDHRRILDLREEVQHDDGDALEDLMLVVGQQVAARRPAHRVVEEVVEVQAERPVLARRLADEAVDRVLHRLEVCRDGAHRRAARDLHLDRPPGLEELAQRRLRRPLRQQQQRGRDVVGDHGDAAVDPAAALDDAVLGEDADRLADSGLAHLHVVRHLLDRGKPVADAVRTGADRERDLVDDPLVHPRVVHRPEQPASRADRRGCRGLGQAKASGTSSASVGCSSGLCSRPIPGVPAISITPSTTSCCSPNPPNGWKIPG